jgi:hypothetical protein
MMSVEQQSAVAEDMAISKNLVSPRVGKVLSLKTSSIALLIRWVYLGFIFTKTGFFLQN